MALRFRKRAWASGCLRFRPLPMAGPVAVFLFKWAWRVTLGIAGFGPGG